MQGVLQERFHSTTISVEFIEIIFVSVLHTRLSVVITLAE